MVRSKVYALGPPPKRKSILAVAPVLSPKLLFKLILKPLAADAGTPARRARLARLTKGMGWSAFTGILIVSLFLTKS